MILNKSKLKLNESAGTLKTSTEHCTSYYSLIFWYEKALFKVNAAQAHDRIDRERKCCFTKTLHMSMKTMTKIKEMDFKSLPHSSYSLDLISKNCSLFSDLKRMLSGKTFSSNEEVIGGETVAYFEANRKKRWMDVIISLSPLKGTILNNKKKN